MAYSGERGAGLAYNGHWKSLKRSDERASIRKIEREEWEHREIVGAMLKELDSEPAALRDWCMGIIGRTIGFSCYLIGWFLPMYFAGRLEHANVAEYDVAAGHAAQLGLNDFAAELSRLSEVEHQHEEFFLNTISGHKLVPLMKTVFGWGPASVDTPHLLSGAKH
jgi:demethoxyubiquinone hydroxylase (CLK1/Coq7/Cat5 family)